MSQWSAHCHLISEMFFVGDDQIQEGRLLARAVSGNMSPYIVDYMNYYNMSVQHTSAVWLTSVGYSMQAIAMPLAGWIATRIGFRIVVFCSCVVHSGSIALTYFAIKWGFTAVVLIYGVLGGLGFGAGYSVILAVASAWFPSHRGLIVGLVLGGFGGGAVVFTPIQTAFINPYNVEINSTSKSFTDIDVLNRVPYAFLLLAGITGSIQIIGFVLMQEKPKVRKPNVRGSLCSGLNVDVRPIIVLQASDFYLLWLSVCFSSVPITLVSALFKVAGIQYIHDDLFLTGVSMAASVCNCVGHVLWGIACDRFSFKLPMCCMCVVWTTLLFSFPFISVFTGTAARVTFVLWVGLMFLCHCGIFVFAPTAAANIFGPVNMAVNYGMTFTAF
ncbi:oxalate:formate antiporter, partial [Clonorchis sinensis]